MEGFVAEVDPRMLAQLLAPRGIPLVHDLGSGLLISLAEVGLTGEPTVADAVKGGAALVTMSGDKLLGGPQAGLIVGAGEMLRRLRKNPLLRSLRVDKLTIAALEATLMLYRDPARALREIPVLAMLGASLASLRARAEAIAANVRGLSIVESEASVGGGAFPNARIPSIALSIAGSSTKHEARLRLGDPAVIGPISYKRLLIDLRAVLPSEDEQLGAAVRAALAS